MEPKLKKSFNRPKDFLSLFYHEIDSFKLTPKTKIDLFILDIDASDFDYSGMIDELGNASVYYAISRARITELKKAAGAEHAMVKEAVTKLRNWEVNDGEGGELLLYCFLESHLNAPKILTKLELKTAGNDYVKGSDGVHLLKLKSGEYHLIFAESKLIPKITKAFYQAFGSIAEFAENKKTFELALVESQLLKEAFDDDELYTFLKDVIKPKQSSSGSSIRRSTAFGILVGFEIDINDLECEEIEDKEFSLLINSRVKAELESSYEYIKKQISTHGLEGHHFYIYAIPFLKRNNRMTSKPITSLGQKRQDIIKEIKMQ